MEAGARLGHLGHRLRLVAKLLRLVEAFTAILLISWSSSRLPWLATISFRVLLDHRFVFLLGNLIVVLLFALFRHDTTSTTSLPNTAYDDNLLSPITTSSNTSSITSQYLIPPARNEVKFEDKQAVHVQISSRAPPCPRSQSEKIGKRKKSPETSPANSTLLRCRSENGRGRKKEMEKEEDADQEFRRMIEEFIAKQTKFHHDESMAIVVAGDGNGDGLDGDVGASVEKVVVHGFVKSGRLDEASTTVLT